MYNIKLEIMYQGTRYQGWQRLGNEQTPTTIQGILEERLSQFIGEDVRITGSGRTDAGVHAYGQTANFHTKKELDLKKLMDGMNEALPPDIQITGIFFVDKEFHSRYSAVSKCYEYHISMSDKESVFERNTSLSVNGPLNLTAMEKGAQLLCGTHDFAGFSSAMHDGRKTVKTLSEVEIEKQGEQIIIRYKGDGFLYNMVRIMTGTLLEIGMGQRNPDTILDNFKNPSRQKAGKTVEGKGLFLKKVVYK